MLISELVSLLVFVGVVATVFGVTSLFVLRRLRARLAGQPAAPVGRLERAVFALSALGVLCLLYGRFVEPFWLEVRTERIESAKWPRGAEPLRIVHVSDLQCDPTERLEGRLPGEVAALRPDLIVFTGDAVNSADALPVFHRCFGRLAAIAPTYAIKGNWDIWLVPDVDHFGGTGATVLDGDVARLEVRGVPVQLIGAAMGDPDHMAEAARGLEPGVFSIALFHPPYPEVVPRGARGTLVDLMVAGHVHGGQVALPFYGALVTLSRHGKTYESGLYDVDGMKLHVSRGIGMEGGSAPRVRFFARPEITLIEVVPAAGR